MTQSDFGRRARKGFKRALLPAIIVSLVLGSAAAARGATGSDIPQGGYSALTDACLQCHDVHESAGDYVLLRWRTVTDVCGSCHFLYLTNPGGLAPNEANPKLGGYLDRSPGTGYETEIA